MNARCLSPRSSRWALIPGVLLFAYLPMLRGQSACTPPDEMKARLQGKPNAEAYNDLGVWFADRKNYECATEAFATSLQMEPNQKDLAHVAFMLGVSLYFKVTRRTQLRHCSKLSSLATRTINCT